MQSENQAMGHWLLSGCYWLLKQAYEFCTLDLPVPGTSSKFRFLPFLAFFIRTQWHFRCEMVLTLRPHSPAQERSSSLF